MATASFGRYEEIPTDRMSSAQDDGYQALRSAENSGSPVLPGPLKIWVDNAHLASAVAPLVAHFRPPHHSLSEREREIVTCVTNGKWRAHYSIDAHAKIGVKVGLPPDTVTALVTGQPATFSDQREQLVYEMATSLSSGRWIPQHLYDEALQALGHTGITDVTVLMGLYTAVSLTLAFYDVPAGASGIER